MANSETISRLGMAEFYAKPGRLSAGMSGQAAAGLRRNPACRRGLRRQTAVDLVHCGTMTVGSPHLALVGAVLALLLVSCGPAADPKSSRPEAAPRAVRVAHAELRPMERTVQVVGTLAARDEATVAAQVAGQLEKIPVDLGDRVTADQELALIDTAAYDVLVRQSAANLARVQASAANATQNLQRIQDLRQENIASTSDLDQSVAEAARTRADVKAVEAADAIARLNLERSRVRAPFDGTIAQRLATVGDYVAVGAPIVRLVKLDPLRLRLDVPERESSAVRPGQEVRLTVEGDTNVYAGRLARIAPAISQSDRMLPVEADVPNPGALRAGLFARAQIVTHPGEESLSIPAQALATFAGIEKVVVLQDGKAAERTVTTGRRGVDWMEITSGLKAGEAVVLDPAGIRTGQPLTLDAKAR
jgi:RND family efflux transporter MFP subunit